MTSVSGRILRLFNCFVDSSDKEEGGLGKIVVHSRNDLLEASDRFLQGNVLALHARELLRNVERLGKETLDLSCTAYGELVLVGKLVHAHDSDDILKLGVSLENVLYGSCSLVMLLTDNVGAEYSRCGIKRIHGREDTQR